MRELFLTVSEDVLIFSNKEYLFKITIFELFYSLN